MELKTKYQYTYFIYPYIIDKSDYNRYLQKLLKNKNCKLRIFEQEKDLHLYQYFLPNIRDYMFWSFGLTKKGLKNFESLDIKLRTNLLAGKDCNIFEYQLPKDLQGKIEDRDGLFFDISKIKIICYKTGICFLVFKTTLLESNNFTDILNFNYKFREINSETYNLKEYENIHLQSDNFKDVQEISGLIKELTGNSKKIKKINIDNERFITYSYCCIDQKLWNEESKTEAIDNLFEKYRIFLPANNQVVDVINSEEKELYENAYIRYGFSNTGVVVLTSDINTANYTTVAQKFESEYLYMYILELYKKLLMQKLSENLNKTSNFKLIELDFIDFTKKLWMQEITNSEFGKILNQELNKNLNVEATFLKLKNKYDILFNRKNILKSSEKNGNLAILMVIMIVIGTINLLLHLIK